MWTRPGKILSKKKRSCNGWFGRSLKRTVACRPRRILGTQKEVNFLGRGVTII